MTPVFTGVLDGDGHTIKNLIVEGSNTGMFRTLGDGAVIKNIVFEDAEARNFSNANDAIISSTMSTGARVLFENVALINAKSISSVDGSSRSTHGALIALYDKSTDTLGSVHLKNVYVDYTHSIPRNKDTSNVGGLFGKFVSASQTGIVLEGVYLDIKINNTGANKADNAGAIFGYGNANVTSNDTVIKFCLYI